MFYIWGVFEYFLVVIDFLFDSLYCFFFVVGKVVGVLFDVFVVSDALVV